MTGGPQWPGPLAPDQHAPSHIAEIQSLNPTNITSHSAESNSSNKSTLFGMAFNEMS
jgi:hypothetical protein